jgi:hypothetical protein
MATAGEDGSASAASTAAGPPVRAGRFARHAGRAVPAGSGRRQRITLRPDYCIWSSIAVNAAFTRSAFLISRALT